MDEKGERYYTGRGPNVEALERHAAEIAKSRQRPSAIDSTFLTATDVSVERSMRESNAMFPQIKPLLKKRHAEKAINRSLSHFDPNMIISEQSVTGRYLK